MPPFFLLCGLFVPTPFIPPLFLSVLGAGLLFPIFCFPPSLCRFTGGAVVPFSLFFPSFFPWGTPSAPLSRVLCRILRSSGWQTGAGLLGCKFPWVVCLLSAGTTFFNPPTNLKFELFLCFPGVRPPGAGRVSPSRKSLLDHF